MYFKEVFIHAFTENKKALLLAGGAGLTVVGLGLGYRYFLKPEKVTRVGIVSQLLIHPLKSGKAVSVALAECQQIGLKYGELQDRHWLVITEEDGHFVTGRQEPRLVLVSLTSEGGRTSLNGPDMEELRFPLMQPNNPVINCRVFSTDIQGRDCGDEASSWLTRYLAAGKTFRLVHFEPHMTPRRAADKEPLFPRNEKDSWEDIQIGNVRLHRVMACGRCISTTVDPETGVITRKQPLDTLKSYRMCDPSQKNIYKAAPLFGQMYIVSKTGILQVGDVVYKTGH
ncbi:hypothetical protein J4Q44_G00254940 [Coregonus suidteri]|uniref:MOSC domain-containing protein n=1 Tax=Coregonus suidteri TaxID=861788 RepID=A0AAN8QNY6_9TELE